MKDGISGGSGIPANRNKFVDRGNAPLNRAEYESRKASIFGDNDVKELKRTVGNDEKHEILVGRDNTGKTIRVDAKTLEELVTVETTGKNTYMTKSEFNKLIEQVLHVKELPAGMTAEFQHGNLVFKRGGDVLTAKDLREDAGLIAQRQKEKLEAEREMTQKLLEDVKPLSLTPDLDMSRLSEVKIKNLPSPTATVALQDTPAPAPSPTPTTRKRIVNTPKPAGSDSSPLTPLETSTSVVPEEEIRVPLMPSDEQRKADEERRIAEEKRRAAGDFEGRLTGQKKPLPEVPEEEVRVPLMSPSQQRKADEERRIAEEKRRAAEDFEGRLTGQKKPLSGIPDAPSSQKKVDEEKRITNKKKPATSDFEGRLTGQKKPLQEVPEEEVRVPLMTPSQQKKADQARRTAKRNRRAAGDFEGRLTGQKKPLPEVPEEEVRVPLMTPSQQKKADQARRVAEDKKRAAEGFGKRLRGEF